MGAASAAMPSVLQQLMTANNALNAEQGGSRQQPSMRHPANPYMQMNYSGVRLTTVFLFNDPQSFMRKRRDQGWRSSTGM